MDADFTDGIFRTPDGLMDSLGMAGTLQGNRKGVCGVKRRYSFVQGAI
jgi:hypothetical protein